MVGKIRQTTMKELRQLTDTTVAKTKTVDRPDWEKPWVAAETGKTLLPFRQTVPS